MGTSKRVPANLAEHRWEHAGIECAISFYGGHHGCGYVRVPEALRANLPADWNDVDVHGGITWPADETGVDADGWIGFDTAHAGDSWAEPVPTNGTEIPALGLLARELCDAFGASPRGDKTWTTDRLRAETNRLAEQVARMAAAVAR